MTKSIVQMLVLVHFIFVQSVFAGEVDPRVERANQFIKETKLNQKPKPLLDFVNQFGQKIPPNIRLQLLSYAKENPEAEIPVLTVTSHQVKGKKLLQISIVSKAMNVLIESPSATNDKVWGDYVGSIGKTNIKGVIDSSVFKDENKKIYQARLAAKHFKESAVPGIMPYQVFLKLSLADRVHYIKSMHAVLAAEEKLEPLRHPRDLAQNQFGNQCPAGSWTLLLRILMGKEALANNLLASCNFAGNQGSWANASNLMPEMPGHCVDSDVWVDDMNGGHAGTASIKGGCSQSQVLCNPNFYGPSVCVDYDPTMSSTRSLAQDCSSRVNYEDLSICRNPKASKEAQADFDKHLKDFQSRMADAYNASCGIGTVNNGKGAGADQGPECAQMAKELDNFSKLSCGLGTSQGRLGSDDLWNQVFGSYTEMRDSYCPKGSPDPGLVVVPVPAPAVQACAQVSTTGSQYCMTSPGDCLGADGKSVTQNNGGLIFTGVQADHVNQCNLSADSSQCQCSADAPVVAKQHHKKSHDDSSSTDQGNLFQGVEMAAMLLGFASVVDQNSSSSSAVVPLTGGYGGTYEPIPIPEIIQAPASGAF